MKNIQLSLPFILILLFALIAFIFILNDLTQRQADNFDREANRSSISFQSVNTADLHLRSTSAGIVTPLDHVEIIAEQSGKLEAVHVSHGDMVDAGQPLFNIEPLLWEVKEAIASSHVNNLKKTASENEQDEVMILASTHAAANHDIAKLDLASTTTKAPFGGMFVSDQRATGDYVKRGDLIGQLINWETLNVYFFMPVQHASKLQVGSLCIVQSDVVPGEHFYGTINYKQASVDEGQKVLIRAQLPNPSFQLSPGDEVTVTQVLPMEKKTILVPRSSLLIDHEQNEIVVYKVVNNRIISVPVLLGQVVGGSVEVISGLTADDVVMTEGQYQTLLAPN